MSETLCRWLNVGGDPKAANGTRFWAISALALQSTFSPAAILKFATKRQILCSR